VRRVENQEGFLRLLNRSSAALAACLLHGPPPGTVPRPGAYSAHAAKEAKASMARAEMPRRGRELMTAPASHSSLVSASLGASLPLGAGLLGRNGSSPPPPPLAGHLVSLAWGQEADGSASAGDGDDDDDDDDDEEDEESEENAGSASREGGRRRRFSRWDGSSGGGSSGADSSNTGSVGGGRVGKVRSGGNGGGAGSWMVGSGDLSGQMEKCAGLSDLVAHPKWQDLRKGLRDVMR